MHRNDPQAARTGTPLTREVAAPEVGQAPVIKIARSRLWLDVLPGVAVPLGGVLLAATRSRAAARLAPALALAGGIWFVMGRQISRLWTGSGSTAVGAVTGVVAHQVAQYPRYFFGLGIVISVLAAHAAGRLTVLGLRDVRTGLAGQAQ